jgi:uncharacterized damage-inducible protein DinB
MKTILKPTPDQHPDWASVYIKHVPDDGKVLDFLAEGLKEVVALVQPLTDEAWNYRYAEDKWTIKEMLVHLMDAERVFTYRGLSAARGDKTSLPGFDHNAYVPVSRANKRMGDDILAEYQALRAATIAFFQNLDEEALNTIGEAKDQPCSARGMVYMIAGHERHHLQILRERYINIAQKRKYDFS